MLFINSSINVNALKCTLIYIWNLGSKLPLGSKDRLGMRIEVKRSFSSVLFYLHIFKEEHLQMCVCVYFIHILQEIKT